MLLYTVGYQGRSLPEMTDLLASRGITLVVDVRERPYSKKRGFSKDELKEALAEKNIKYRSMPLLGAPPKLRQKVKEGGSYQEFFQLYREHLKQQQQALLELKQLVPQEVTCLLCYEKDPDFCHRTVIAQEISTPENTVPL